MCVSFKVYEESFVDCEYVLNTTSSYFMCPSLRRLRPQMRLWFFYRLASLCFSSMRGKIDGNRMEKVDWKPKEISYHMHVTVYKMINIRMHEDL